MLDNYCLNGWFTDTDASVLKTRHIVNSVAIDEQRYYYVALEEKTEIIHTASKLRGLH